MRRSLSKRMGFFVMGGLMSETSPKRILVVEDDELLADNLKRRLELEHFVVETESSGARALSYAAEHRPDLVILDLKLPDINGYEVCRELRKLYHPWIVPILMLTGMDKPIDQLRGFAHGADVYMTKPYEPAELLKTVNLLLGQTTLA